MSAKTPRVAAAHRRLEALTARAHGLADEILREIHDAESRGTLDRLPLARAHDRIRAGANEITAFIQSESLG